MSVKGRGLRPPFSWPDPGYAGPEPRIHKMASFNSLKAKKGQLDIEVGVTFANLPTPPALGMIRMVTDATQTIVGKTANGGGSAKVLVWYNGTAWRVLGGTDA